MIERDCGNGAIVESAQWETAKKVIQGKTLWMVPNWDCNRLPKPCKICFATGIMWDAKTKGYQHAGPDFFAKVEVLSQLPWKEVIITGGEPMQDLEVLKTTLSAINPDRPVRIITNGDWALKKNADQISSIISASGRDVSVDISAHQPEEIVLKKVRATKRKLQSNNVGIQIRTDEILSPAIRRGFVYQGFPDGIRTESHEVLRLGEAKLGIRWEISDQTQHGTILKLKQLIDYSGHKNQGIYLIAGENGTRAIANHETPYLVFPTPADIVSPTDDSTEVVRKVIDFYADKNRGFHFYELDSKTTLGYVRAAFQAGVPLRLSDNFIVSKNVVRIVGEKEDTPTFVRRNKKIMDVYYQVIAERCHISVDTIKDFLMQKMAERISEIEKVSQEKVYASREVEFEPMTFFVAEGVPRDQESLASIIAKCLWEEIKEGDTYERQELARQRDSNGNYRLFPRGQTFEDHRLEEDFINQLNVLDIPPEGLARKLNRTYTRF